MSHCIDNKDALNKAYRKQKPLRNDIERFKTNLKLLLENIDEEESEEHCKNHLIRFLRETYYADRYEINTYGKTDLVIHNDKTAKSSVGVLLEAKRPRNKVDMVMQGNLNAKAMQELLLYYLRERHDKQNTELKYCIITNAYDWFIFDASEFYQCFYQDKTLLKEYDAWKNGQKESTSTDYFYKTIASPEIQNVAAELSYTYVSLTDYKQLLQEELPEHESKLVLLYKLFSPEHLLKQPFTNDSNTLDKKFYNELLHIIGLTETKEKGKKLIERKSKGERDPGSLLENAITVLEAEDHLGYLQNAADYGSTKAAVDTEEQLFTLGLELTIIWLNRILFLKLLEAQLLKYHSHAGKHQKEYAFLNFEKIRDFDDLNALFFQVLAKKTSERSDRVQQTFGKVPYLNSSLFEPTDLEHRTIRISNLEDRLAIPVIAQTVLKDEKGKSLKNQELTTLAYLFRFLDAYDFSSEGSDEIQEENKTLINASVLGLIFEKINGYKDGSFFTPGFITMYMCRETIRRAVVQKFNERYGWQCREFDQLYNKIENIKEANELVNDLKICDPAVGSGHFLVSALNEMISIKSELDILCDREGKRLRDYKVEVVNDELIITCEGEIFTYKPGSHASQRVQEALFHEKENIIENCLFGVDININSVKICRLRLWIELLKNAYYTADSQFTELETLPNIDINIKTGNSLLYRFDLQEDLSEVFRQQKFSLRTYKDAVAAYRNTFSKDAKQELLRFIREIKEQFRTSLSNRDPMRKKMSRLRGEIDLMENPADLFGNVEIDQKLLKKKKKELEKLEQEKADIEANKMYEGAFEWRFEFPEVLDDKGYFVGFDVVIGNPPYIRQEELGDFKNYLQNKYRVYAGTADLYVYFVEQGINLLKDAGNFIFILPNKWMRANYGKSFRQWLKKLQIEQIIDFGDLPVFEEATTYPCILSILKQAPDGSFLAAEIASLEFSETLAEYLLPRLKTVNQELLNDEGWSLQGELEQKLLEKIKSNGIPLGEYVHGKVYYGIKTGLNEAFVIDQATKEKLIAEDQKSKEVIKPFLAGRDIKRYSIPKETNFIILFPKGFTKEGFGDLNSQNAWESLRGEFPAICRHLEAYSSKGQKRYDQGDYWWELRACDYYEEFVKPKIIYPNICKQPEFAFDSNKNYTNQKCFIIPGEDKYLLAILNSNVTNFLFEQILPKLRGDFYEPSYLYFKNFPIANNLDSESKSKITSIVDQILEHKKIDPKADTSELENEIDQMIYNLYDLTEEEIAIVEGREEVIHV